MGWLVHVHHVRLFLQHARHHVRNRHAAKSVAYRRHFVFRPGARNRRERGGVAARYLVQRLSRRQIHLTFRTENFQTVPKYGVSNVRPCPLPARRHERNPARQRADPKAPRMGISPRRGLPIRAHMGLDWYASKEAGDKLVTLLLKRLDVNDKNKEGGGISDLFTGCIGLGCSSSNQIKPISEEAMKKDRHALINKLIDTLELNINLYFRHSHSRQIYFTNAQKLNETLNALSAY